MYIKKFIQMTQFKTRRSRTTTQRRVNDNFLGRILPDFGLPKVCILEYRLNAE